MAMDQRVRFVTRPMATIAMAVECERFILINKDCDTSNDAECMDGLCSAQTLASAEENLLAYKASNTSSQPTTSASSDPKTWFLTNYSPICLVYAWVMPEKSSTCLKASLVPRPTRLA